LATIAENGDSRQSTNTRNHINMLLQSGPSTVGGAIQILAVTITTGDYHIICKFAASVWQKM